MQNNLMLTTYSLNFSFLIIFISSDISFVSTQTFKHLELNNISYAEKLKKLKKKI